jgi:ribosomal protein S12 methylthiotransferase accessory factor YcaO
MTDTPDQLADLRDDLIGRVASGFDWSHDDAAAVIDTLIEFAQSQTPGEFTHPPWQVQMKRNDDGTHDIGLVLAGRSTRLTWQEATTLSVALKVAVDNATTAEPDDA